MKNIPVLYENEEILVVNKAAGIPVQGGVSIKHPLDRELSVQQGYKVYLVHRLDRDTAGILVVAKTPAAASRWTKILGSGGVRKEYRAVCIGMPRGGMQGTIRQAVVQHGRTRNAVTQYKILAVGTAAGSNAAGPVKLSLVSLRLDTGRMHQIRIHLAAQGAPIAGDDRHGDFGTNKILKKSDGIRQLLLASCSLSLPLAAGEKTFTIPLPEYMQSVVDTFTYL
ncbi:MAG: RNA pseudouridine synthase [Treponema sp.]|jgi:23S rRNA pseudouridine955/2504/2580 synthase|nr:RNA pseudouridine synthase [Treponema sp.]